MLDYLDELQKDDAKLLKELLTCPAEKLFEHNQQIIDSNKFNEQEVKILSYAISYGYSELCKAAKTFFRTHNFVHSCPYCNLENAKYVPKKNGGTARVHQLDHFFSKAKSPLLALSMYNLVPCGTDCNDANNKGEIPFTDEFHLNPYVDGFNGQVRFYPIRKGTKVKNIGIITGWKPADGCYKQILGDDSDKSKKRLEKGNMNVFALGDKYSDKIDSAQDVLNTIDKRVNGMKSISMFIDQMRGIDLGEVHKVWYRNEMKTHFEPEKFHKKDMSKFNRDIHDFYIMQDGRFKTAFIKEIIKY